MPSKFFKILNPIRAKLKLKTNQMLLVSQRKSNPKSHLKISFLLSFLPQILFLKSNNSNYNHSRFNLSNNKFLCILILMLQQIHAFCKIILKNSKTIVLDKNNLCLVYQLMMNSRILQAILSQLWCLSLMRVKLINSLLMFKISISKTTNLKWLMKIKTLIWRNNEIHCIY